MPLGFCIKMYLNEVMTIWDNFQSLFIIIFLFFLLFFHFLRYLSHSFASNPQLGGTFVAKNARSQMRSQKRPQDDIFGHKHVCYVISGIFSC